MQPERLPSLARRERDKPRDPIDAPKVAELFPAPRVIEAPVSKAAEPIVVQIAPRPRIRFLEVVRNDTEDIVGLRPIYESEGPA